MMLKISAHDERRETEARLVEQQQSRLRHQRPAQRQHLSLAARQRSGQLRATLGKPRKALIDVVARTRNGAVAGAIALKRAKLQVVRHRHRGEQLAPLGYQAQPLGDALLDWDACHRLRRHRRSRRARAAAP